MYKYSHTVELAESPCYDKKNKVDCPRRAVGCAVSCPEWKAYLERRESLYGSRKLKKEAYFASVGHILDRLNQRIRKYGK